MTRSSLSLAVASLSLLLAGGSARADYIYNWDPDVPKIFSDHAGMLVQLTNGGQVGPVSGNQNTVATVLSTSINPGVTGSDTFTQNNLTGLKLTITDGTQNGSVDFPLRITGSLSAQASQLTYNFLDGTSKSLTVNGHNYTATLNGGVSGAVPGTIRALIATASSGGTGSGNTGSGSTGSGGTGSGSTGSGGTGSGSTGSGSTGGTTTSPPHSAPEPASVALAGLGSVLLAVAGWRKRRVPPLPA
jgi:hypothetical protein